MEREHQAQSHRGSEHRSGPQQRGDQAQPDALLAHPCQGNLGKLLLGLVETPEDIRGHAEVLDLLDAVHQFHGPIRQLPFGLGVVIEHLPEPRHTGRIHHDRDQQVAADQQTGEAPVQPEQVAEADQQADEGIGEVAGQVRHQGVDVSGVVRDCLPDAA